MRSIKNKIMNNSHINFARNCMIELLSKKDEPTGFREISSLDLHKIEEILNRYKPR
jgi:hypothetical protein